MKIASSASRVPTNYRSIASAILLLALVPGGLPGADRVWDGEGVDNNWQTGANWDPFAGGTVPVENDALFFDGNVRTSPVNNFPAGTIFQNITFNLGADVFNLGGNSLTLPNPPAAVYTGGLNAPYTGGSISNLSGSPQTISLPLILGNGHHYISADSGGGSLNLSGAMTLGVAASASFSGGVNVTGSGLANLNGILGGWATLLPPTTWAALDGSGNVVGFTAFIDVGAGENIASSAAANVRLTTGGGTNALANAGATDINTLFFDNTGANQVVDVAAGRILRLGSKGGILNASRQFGTSRVLTIGVATGVGFVTAGGADNTPGDLYLIETPFVGNTGNQLVMNSRITNNGTGIVTVHTFGHVSYPNVTHTYSGGTYIHGGRIQTVPSILGTGPIHIYPGGQLFFNANGTCANNIFMAGYGNAESVGNGAIRMGGTGRIITGTVTLTADAATANGTINGRITGPGGLIVGAGSGNGVGTLILGATNDYAGETLINGTNATAASTLQMTTGRPHIMPHGAGKGNLNLRGINSTMLATFNLNGTDQSINGLDSSGTEGSAIITNTTAATVATLTLGDGNANGNFGGAIASGVGSVALVKIGMGTQILRGSNTYTNGTTVNAGTLVFSVPGSFPASSGPVTVNNNAVLDLAAVTPLTLGGSQTLTTSNGTIAAALQSVGNSITTPTLNSLGATNFIRVTDIPSISTYPAQFTVIKYTTLNGALNFGLGGSLPISPGTPFAGFVSNNVANGSVDVVITAGPASVRWSGYSSGAPNSAWDTTTPNWVTLLGAATTYADGSFATFLDSASNGVVTLAQNVLPASVTVSNSSLNYTFNGTGGIGGIAGIAKSGSGSLILANTGVNSFSGDLSISGGTLQLGNNDTGGNLPNTPILNNGTLAFSRTDALTFPNIVSGSGGLRHNGSGVTTLSAANTFSGNSTILQGTVVIDNNNALGVTNGSTTVASGGTLDVGSPNLGQDGVSVFEPISVAGFGTDGLGAIVNNTSTRQLNALKFVTLTNNTSFGGAGRWDIRAPGGTTGNPLGARLSTGGQPYSLIKTGANIVIIVSATVDPALGNIDVRQGEFQVEGNITSLGNENNTLTVQPGATLAFFSVTNWMNKVFVLNGDGTATTMWNDAGNNTVVGPMTFNGPCIVDSDGGTSLTLSNTITGAGTLTKIDVGSLTLNGTSPNFAGGLRVSAGTLTVGASGTISHGLGVQVAAGKFALHGNLLGPVGITNDAGAFLAGSGTTAGPVFSSGHVSPGDTNGVLGTLTTSNLVLEFGSTLDFDLTATNAVGGGTNDLIVVNGDLTVNGNPITIVPIGPLQKGPTRPYRLFNYTGNLIWNGDLSVSGPNNYTYAVDTNTPGQINIVASGGPPIWDGGSATVNNWSDPANWGGITIASGDSLFFAGNNRLNNTNNTTVDTTYTDLFFNFDAGPFVLNGNSIVLGGTIINNSPNPQTVKLPINYGVTRTLNGIAGPLIVGGGVTNTANLVALTLAGTGILTNIVGTLSGAETNTLLLNSSNANWTIVDNPASSTITVPWVVNVNNGTLNFGMGSSGPKFTSTTVNGAPQDNVVGTVGNATGTFNMINGTFTTIARLNTGTAGGATGIVNQVGGTMNIGNQLQGANGAATAVSFINVSGGAMNIMDPNGTLQELFVASRGPGVVTLSGSGTITCGTLDVSRSINSGIPGTFNLNGGTLTVSRVGTATANSGAATTGSTATFNFNGGTLRANASSTTWFQGNTSSPAVPITAIVKAGGAIIDSDTNSVSVQEPLQHDSALGATPDGGLTKQGVGTLTLSALSTYTGPTTVSAGTLMLSGTLRSSAVTVNGGTLAGNGICGTTLTVNGGGTVSPGTSPGILTVTNNISLNGVTLMEIRPSLVTNDLLRSISGTITYGGTLRVTNIGGVFVNGASYKLFNAASYLNAFTTLQLPGLSAGQSWNTSQLNVNGTISVVGNPAPPVITSVAVSGNNLIISGSNGTTNGTFQVLASGNVAAPVNTWTVLGVSDFDADGDFSVQVPIDPNTPQRFFLIQLQ